MNGPKVSVIIPNYNHSAYLESRFASVFSQTFQDFEVIVLDDCSSDGSRAVIERSGSRFKQVVINEENSGSAFRQWKKGLSLASGELVWIAESDDLCEENMLETLVSAFDADPSCVLSFCRSAMFEEGSDAVTYHEFQKRFRNDFVMDGVRFCREFQKDSNCVVNASSAVFRRDAALRAGDEFIEYKGLGDMLFWYDIAMKGNVHYSNAPMNKFRQHPDSQTSVLKETYRKYEESLSVRSILYKERKALTALQYWKTRAYTLYCVRKSRTLSEKEKEDLFRMSDAGFFTKLYVNLKTLAQVCHLKS